MEKPWFKFTATNWLSGSIQLLNDAEMGTYINLLAMIWKEGGSIELNNILSRKLRIDHATACDRIKSYCELDILICEGDILSVKFLSDQLDGLKEVSRKNSENAKKRWENKGVPMRQDANKKRKEEKREDKKTKAKKVYELPSWVDSKTWADFEEMRKAKKKPLTDRARTTIINKLKGFGEAKADQILEQSITHCWDTVYDLKQDTNNQQDDSNGLYVI